MARNRTFKNDSCRKDIKTKLIMRKKILKASLAIAVIVSAGHGAYKAYSSYENANMSEKDFLLIENVLALSDDNSGCHNINGYREWKLSSLFGSKKEFYDCCSVLRSGYSPAGNCN